jgi:hypothetical protein
VARRRASAGPEATRAWRETSTLGTPTPSSSATSDWMPWATRYSFIPTAGRQQARVGETRAGPSSGSSITTATWPRSPASHCSLCPSSVYPGPATVTVEQRSPPVAPLIWPGERAPRAASSGSSSSKALTQNSSQNDTPDPSAIPVTSSTRSGSSRSAAARYGASSPGSSPAPTPRRTR